MILRDYKIAKLIEQLGEANRFLLDANVGEYPEFREMHIEYMKAYRRGLIIKLKHELENEYAWFDEMEADIDD